MGIRIPFVSSAGLLTYSVAAAASQSINIFVEVIDTKDDQQKNIDILRVAPGAHLLATMATPNIRGMWSGGGRLFLVSGAHFYEVASDGSIVSNYDLGSNDTNPAWIQGNFNQLGIVANGFFYISNGGQPVIARFQLNGVITALSTAITWASGDKFPTYSTHAWDPLPPFITISGNNYAVASWNSDTSVTLAAPYPGSGIGTCSTFYSDVYWASGDLFSPGMVGLPILINNVSYTVAHFVTPQFIQLTDTSAGVQGIVSYSAVQANLTYSVAGGDQVTAVTGAYLDDLFFVQRPSGSSPDLGRQVNFSAPNDGTVWNGLDFFTKEGGPDYIQAIFADHELLNVFGTEESEVWQVDPGTGNPTRIPGAAAREGLAARWSVASIAEKIYFIGGSPRGGPIAYRLDGFTPTRISTHAVEQAWSLATFAPDSTDGTCYPYIDQGHQFWVINFAGNVFSWVYDVTASEQLGSPQWHQRSRWNGTALLPYLWWFHTFIPEWNDGQHDGAHVVGDYNSGRIAFLDQSFTDDLGVDIKWGKGLPYRWNNGKQLYFGRMDLEMETGQTAVTSVPEPTITRRYSDDRGQTYSAPQDAGVGFANDFSKIVYWPNGGSSRGRVWHFSGFASSARTLINLYCEDTEGTV